MSVAPLAIFISLTTRTFTTVFVRDRFGIDVAATPAFAASHQVSLWGLALSGNCGDIPLFPGFEKKWNKLPVILSVYVFPFFDSIILVGHFWVGCILFGDKPNPKNPVVGWSYVFTAAIPFRTNKVPELHPEVLRDPLIYSWRASLTMRPNY